jgi:hypothetical protein
MELAMSSGKMVVVDARREVVDVRRDSKLQNAKVTKLWALTGLSATAEGQAAAGRGWKRGVARRRQGSQMHEIQGRWQKNTIRSSR